MDVAGGPEGFGPDLEEAFKGLDEALGWFDGPECAELMAEIDALDFGSVPTCPANGPGSGIMAAAAILLPLLFLQTPQDIGCKKC